MSARWPWLDDVVRRWADRIERVLGGADSVRRRQLRCGRPADVDAFRAEQVVWGAVAGGVGLVVALVVVLQTDASPIGMALLVLVATGCGVVAKDQALTREVARREALMLVEFPTIAELLALAIGAGEGASGALERVCRLSSGELSHELRLCLADARAGLSLPAALHLLADRTGLPSLARFVEGIVVAVERGTPLADVMRAQAQDVREESRRAVMEEGGRKEIAMMIPVVFLILPVTVVFAVFPGLALLQITV
ncbi:type II secretion system F family protein [Arsenicicoccus piscis]|uniref:Type II secretion system protein GspF domain-containing protein n=1 Tax=Arsenicicoccus piscis TaxID=673954 RepID=A0ABQ6HK88_9MICO|nr:hypothetical protein GCM10025862_05980 [Arsenicicoccus piscis]